MLAFRQSTRERVKQLRALMLIHSYLYYVMDEAIVSDHQWQLWADELVKKQKILPTLGEFYDQEFADWNASTGFHLPQDKWVREKAARILQLHQKRTNQTRRTTRTTRKTLRKQLTFF